MFLIKKRELLMAPLAAALQTAIEKISVCRSCGNIDTQNPCTLCTDPRRDASTIVVVADVADLWALERAHAINARYHVLGGILSPLDGVGPDDLSIDALMKRTSDPAVTEVILARLPRRGHVGGGHSQPDPILARADAIEGGARVACNLVRVRPQTHHGFDKSAAKCRIDPNLTPKFTGIQLGPVTARLGRPLARPLHDRGWRSRCHQAWRVEIAGAPEFPAPGLYSFVVSPALLDRAVRSLRSQRRNMPFAVSRTSRKPLAVPKLPPHIGANGGPIRRMRQASRTKVAGWRVLSPLGMRAKPRATARKFARQRAVLPHI